jgi:hypothetical protein
MIKLHFKKRVSILIPLFFCITAGITVAKSSNLLPRIKGIVKVKADSIRLLSHLQHMVSNPFSVEVPNKYKQAIAHHTRSKSGGPGPKYWQQKSDYNINIELLPKKRKLVGQSTITYHNNSPDTLHRIYFQLPLNIDKKGAIRNLSQRYTTSGFHIRSFSYDGEKLYPGNRYHSRNQSKYVINGTIMKVIPPRPLLPSQSVTMRTRFYFKIPRSGAGTGRIGYDDDNLFFIAYFYPKIRVYDDVNGWFKDPFLGIAQFYNEFGHYEVNITVPPQWIVVATGKLTNADEILLKPILQRLIKAHHSDSVVHVVQKKDFGRVTKSPANGKLTWHFTAQKVNDFAFSVTKRSMWDATMAPVNDQDGDGTIDYTYINAFYHSSAARLWKYVV